MNRSSWPNATRMVVRLTNCISKAAHSEDWLKRIEYLRLAVEKDPKFALGYARLAHEYEQFGIYRLWTTQEAYTKRRDMAARALEVDPGLGEAHLVLSDALVNLSWDWKSAERELKQAISL